MDLNIIGYELLFRSSTSSLLSFYFFQIYCDCIAFDLLKHSDPYARIQTVDISRRMIGQFLKREDGFAGTIKR